MPHPAQIIGYVIKRRTSEKAGAKAGIHLRVMLLQPGDGLVRVSFQLPVRRMLRHRGEGGPVTGITGGAEDIAEQLSGDGVHVGRSSHRLRNPDNVAPGWAQPVLDEWSLDASDAAPVALALPGDRVGYVEPIVVQPMCLNCHGAEVSRDVALRLEATE